MQAWREYTSHLNNKEMLKLNNRGWGEKKYELLVALAFEMGKVSGYAHIDKATLRDNIYVPQGYEDNDAQYAEIRATLLRILRGEKPLPVTTVGPIEVAESPATIAPPSLGPPTTKHRLNP